MPGELKIAGDGLARSYINRPELTNERFITHRLSETLPERLYRSGDLVRWLDGGEIEFLGRTRQPGRGCGFGVEMSEIEATLARRPNVREVVVVARPAGDGDKRLVAYVVVNGSVDARKLPRISRKYTPHLYDSDGVCSARPPPPYCARQGRSPGSA